MAVARWREKLPARDWRKWGMAYFGHASTGAIASAGTAIAIYYGYPLLVPAFLWLSVMECIHQYLGFLRKNDTPSRDVADHMVGYIVGLAIGSGYIIGSNISF